MLGDLGFIIPGEQFVDAGDLVVSDTGQNISEQGLGVNVAKFGGSDQCVGDGGGFSASVRPHEEVIFTTDYDGAGRPLGSIVIQFEKAIFQIRRQPFHT